MRALRIRYPLSILICACSLLPSLAIAQTETILYTFTGGSDGGVPYGSLVMDREGNLYGTTIEYGNGLCNFGYTGCGTIFKLSPSGADWNFSVLYTFQGGEDGANPSSTLAFDSQGNLYGTTDNGGSSSGYGYGTVFELHRTRSGWTEEVLYRFTGNAGGSSPNSIVVNAADDVVYGTTRFGGNLNCSVNGQGCGVVFQLERSGKSRGYRVLHTFQGGNIDGAEPQAAVTIAPVLPYDHVPSEPPGSIYGVTKYGAGSSIFGGGVVFQLVPSGNSWKYHILYSFPPEAGGPAGPLVFDNNGNIYGMTDYGGHCCGSVFELQPPNPRQRSWREVDLWDFNGPPDGFFPVYQGVVRDHAGNLYATTSEGGTSLNCNGGCGTAFRLTQTGGVWNENNIYSFTGGTEGVSPFAALTLDSDGNAYGMTLWGGDSGCSAFGQPGCGVVYKITGLAP